MVLYALYHIFSTGELMVGKKTFWDMVLVLIAATSLLITGCASTVQQRQTEPVPEKTVPPKAELSKPEQEDTVSKPPQDPQPRDLVAALAVDVQTIEFRDIHFEFDKSELRDEARETLNLVAFVMFDHPELSVLIEGHCDERGSNEYNLALGERRANAAREYLIDMGVEPHRIDTMSYGEEVPLDPRHTEEAWEKNRRDHFVKIIARGTK
jgi:peptidoglycan-associated lipoprotein